jgi:hypothetical protein
MAYRPRPGPKSEKPCTKEDCCAQCQEPGWVDPRTKKPCSFACVAALDGDRTSRTLILA